MVLKKIILMLNVDRGVKMYKLVVKMTCRLYVNYSHLYQFSYSRLLKLYVNKICQGLKRKKVLVFTFY